MTQIIELEIKRFRGIKNYSGKFARELVCLVGRGDSGKTTLLEAIKCVFSPVWNHAFYDVDFYQLDTSEPIEICVSVINIPQNLMSDSKYGLFLRAYDPEKMLITDSVIENPELVPCLTIQLSVAQNLEPKWKVICGRGQNEKEMSATDRSKFNCFMVSDYVDSHFSWSKGNPLNTIFSNSDNADIKSQTVLSALREAKATIDKDDFSHYLEATEKVKKQAASFGLNIADTQTTIDFKDINIKEGKVSLHLGNIPFRLLGKGSRRLASISIQTSIAREGGIALIDEIEQGLEPDRVQQIARTLKGSNSGQVILTTHSREVIAELNASDLMIVLSNHDTGDVKSEYLDIENSRLQGAIRACPEAFFAKRILVCEGSTEVGICRALDSFRRKKSKPPLSYGGVAYINGSGSAFTERAININGLGIPVAVFCDSDVDDSLNPTKSEIRSSGVEIFDCKSGNSIESEFFLNAPWDAVKEAVEYAILIHSKTEESLEDSLKSKYENGSKFPENWRATDTLAVRQAIAKAAVIKTKEWFKRIDHGEALGNIIFKYFNQFELTHLGETLSGIEAWIDG